MQALHRNKRLSNTNATKKQELKSSVWWLSTILNSLIISYESNEVRGDNDKQLKPSVTIDY